MADLTSDGRVVIFGRFPLRRILLPLGIGLGLSGFLLYQDIRHSGDEMWRALQALARPEGRTVLWLILAVAMVVLRDLAYMLQLRLLSERHLSWRAVVEIVLLWDFFAAVSPSILGGAAVAVFMLTRERIGIGRSTAIVFTTVLFDEIFYLLMVPLGLWMAGYEVVFRPLQLIHHPWLTVGMQTAFWSAYGVIAAYVVLLGASLFVWPQAVNRALCWLFMVPWLKRWRRWGLRTARDLLITSVALRRRTTGWWLRIWGMTALAWLARYGVLNCLLAAFAAEPFGWREHALAFARQAALFIVMVLSPTPGSAGVAEAGFVLMFTDLVTPGLVIPLALLWRMLSYYPYLFVGVPVMSRWLQRVYGAGKG